MPVGGLGVVPLDVHDDILPAVGLQVLRHEVRVCFRQSFRHCAAEAIPAIPAMGGRAAQLAKRGAPADDGSATAVKGIVSTLNGAASASASCSARILFRRGGGGNAAVLR